MKRCIPLLFLMTASHAWAGDHLPLCAKAHTAHLVLEVAFTPSGGYSKRLMDKGWGPSERALKMTLATGSILQVLKGSAEPGARVSDAWPIALSPGSPRVPMWKAFFQRKRFRQVVFLRRRGEEWRPVAGAEESAGCESSAHRSWCPGYRDYLDRLDVCLTHSVSHQLLEKVCAAPCAGPLSSIAVFRDAAGHIKRLRHRPDPTLCSHGPDTDYDEGGQHASTVAERPVSSEEAAVLQAERARALAGLTRAETLGCPAAARPRRPPP